MATSKTSLLLWVLAFVAVLTLQLAEASALPYVVLGKRNGREVAVCKRTARRCKYRRLTCPTNCKTRDIIAPGASACYIDCSVTCKAICKHRKVNCHGYGAVCYDPRFIGGDGVMFYFHGQKDQDFCIVSDKNLHINAHFIGKRPEGRPRDYTWVQGLGMLFDSHKFSVAAKKVAKWDDEIDQLDFSFDGQEVTVSMHEGALWTSPNGKVVVERTAPVNNVHIFIDQLVDVAIKVTPITAEDSKIHNYQMTDDDCFAHLEMQFNFFGLSGSVNGVLGVTYQPDFKNPVKVGAPMPTMGGNDKFFSSSLFAADCKVNQFSGAHGMSSFEEMPLVTFPVECSSDGETLACRR